MKDAIFVSYTRNYNNSDAIENKLLNCNEETKEGMIIDDVKK